MFSYQPTKKQKRTTPQLQHQLTEMKEGEWKEFTPFSHLGPIIMAKGVMKGECPDLEPIRWTDFRGRKHAFVGNYPTEYPFPSGDKTVTLRTTDHPPLANRTIMKMAITMSRKLSELKRVTKYWRSLTLPREGFNVCNISKYETGGALATHQDDETNHANDCIASVSFGAPATFTLGKRNDPVHQAIRLEDGDLIFFDRNTPHSIRDVEGERLNFTFRTWNDVAYWNREGVEFPPLEPPRAKNSRSGRKPN